MADCYFSIDKGVGTFTISRPSVRNAINYNVMDGLEAVLDQIENDSHIKLLILTSEGSEAFCSGGDLSAFHKIHSSKDALRMLDRMGMLLYRLFTLPIPTIALINGTAVGGGMELAVACDFRIASTNSKVGFIQGKLGITTGWGGAAMVMERINVSQALDLLMTSKVISAKESYHCGLVNHLFNMDTFKEEADKEIAKWSKQYADVLRAYKEAFLNKINTDDLKQRMKQEIRQCSELWAGENHHQAVQNFLQRK